MVESTIDKIKDITVERQIRKLAGIIDEQNDTISQYGDATADIETLKTSDAKQTADINNLNNTVAPIPAQIQSLIDTDANQSTQINNLKSDVAKNTTATENLNNRVTEVEQDITNAESEITTIKSTITDIQSKDIAQDGTLATHSEQIQGITESLVSDVEILPGTTTGQIKVRIGRESAAAIDSNSYELGLPVSAEIIQGTGPSMFKIQLTMSSGVKVVSNDFVFTTEAIGNDVYISSFTFKAGNQDGYLSADIGLNNGVIIEANNFLVPTDPNVIANITNLQNRMTNVESSLIPDSRITAIETKNTEQDTKISAIELKNTEQDNKISTIETKNTTQDTAIQKNATDISSLNSEVSGIMSDLDTKVAISQGIGNAGKVLGIGPDGNVTPTEVSVGGEEWEEVNLSNFPTDWVAGDIIRFIPYEVNASFTVTSWDTKPSQSEANLTADKNYASPMVTIPIPSSGSNAFALSINVRQNTRYIDFRRGAVNEANYFNSGGGTIIVFSHVALNGGGYTYKTDGPTRSNVSDYIYKMWRLKK